MMLYEKIKNYSDKKFKRALGIPKALFEIFVETLSFSLDKKHKKGGRKPKLSVENILVMYLKYYRGYNRPVRKLKISSFKVINTTNKCHI